MDFEVEKESKNIKIYCSKELEEFADTYLEYCKKDIVRVKDFFGLTQEIPLTIALLDNPNNGNFVYGKSDFSGFFNDTGAYAYINLYGKKSRDYFFKGLMHELVHHIYKYYIYGSNKSRITWVDEGLAQFVSNQKEELKDEKKYNTFLKEYLKEDKIINLNQLNHNDHSFGNNYGYPLSYIAIRYLYETNSHNDFIKLIKDEKTLTTIGETILRDAYTYYDNKINIIEESRRK